MNIGRPPYPRYAECGHQHPPEMPLERGWKQNPQSEPEMRMNSVTADSEDSD